MHDPDEDGFKDLYHQDFIHAISWVACHKLAHHCLNPYQCAAFCHGIVCHNTGKEEADPTLELAMEYAGVLGTIIFDESCHLCDLTEAQVGQNQFAMDVVVVLGSAILLPSRIPKWNPMFPYIALLYVFLYFRPVSTLLPDLSPYHPFHPCHLHSPCT